MTLVKQTNTAKALSRRMMKYNREVHEGSDLVLPYAVEVSKYSTGDFDIEMKWGALAREGYIHQFDSPIRNYFTEKYPSKRIAVVFKGLYIYGDMVSLSVGVNISEW